MAKHLVIMAGGIGSRFWPMSTPQCPKQFLDITGSGRTMIQQAYDRFAGIIDVNNLWVVTSKDYKDLVQEQLEGINPQHILLEPCMRNTAPCIAYVSWKIQKEDPEAVFAVVPSDHLVLKVDEFQKVMKHGFDFVAEGDRILTLGMQPSRPETGYGYIEQGDEECDGIFKLKSFREKPELKTAIQYLQEGGYTWNSGMFLWSAKTIVNELRTHVPEIAEIMDQIVPAMFTEQEQETVNRLFPDCTKISIDYAVMEKTDKAYVIPAEFGWSDLGTWGSLHTLSEHDENNNAVIGNNVKLVETSGCMVRMPQDKQVVIQGLKDCIVAEHNNTLLICQLSEEQRIKEWHD
ncbi:MAG: mannose-1-phosphate guanylyltransferase [Prevotella sp.]|nr:mannose-1-phosphate guanylyltransferase [Prevotella sp.]